MDPIDRRMMLGAAGLAGVAAMTKLASAGPLSPPPGPVGSTGQTLDDIYNRIARTDVGVAEPRIPVQSLPGSATALHVISEPGSYYLTGNIQGVAGKHGIEIVADNVSLDLTGHALRGDAFTGDAVRFTGDVRGAVVENGQIDGWGGASVNGGFAANLCVRRLIVNGLNSGNGIVLGVAGRAEDVTVRRKATAFFTENVASLHRCTAINCEGVGFFLRRAQAIDCVAFGNNAIGFYIEQGGMVDRCEARENNGDGIQAHGHLGVLIRGCNCVSNSAAGIRVQFASDVSASGCNLAANGQAGLIVENPARNSRIEDCAASGSPVGLQIQSGSIGHFIARCTARDCSTPYAIAPGNSHGPIVNVAGVGDISAVPGANHPWANFIY